MPSGAVNVSVSISQIEALDLAAHEQHRQRDDLINEAVFIYLQLQAFHKGLIEKGLKQADAGLTVSQSTVREIFRTWSEGR